ncbi:hypothetical protein D9615_005358 [Tricholomella constricta]|uniref:Uncharacterized protein n=1 Tax=Tricholomella constricta TaxID=117010 RepID=A0A8H5H6J1_9AGAR|nr:hypothetical protein D9615_005358 [Tricholomella constricta]
MPVPTTLTITFTLPPGSPPVSDPGSSIISSTSISTSSSVILSCGSSLSTSHPSSPSSVTTPSASNPMSVTLHRPTGTLLPSTTILSLPHRQPSQTTIPVITATHFTTIHRSSKRRYNSYSPTSSVEPGVLSTNNPKGPTGFALNTAAIVGVSIAATASIIIAVIAIFFACKRYKGRRAFGVSSHGALHFTPWHPPLAGDDDAQYYTDRYGGLVAGSFRQHIGSHSNTNEMATVGTDQSNAERSLSHEASSSESGLSHLHNVSFGRQSLSIYNQAVDAAFPFPGIVNATSVHPPPMSLSGVPDGMPDTYAQQQREASTSAPSLHAGSSSQGHFAASTSSGHGLMAAMALSLPNQGPSRFKSFIGRLRTDRGSLPDIVLHGSSSKSSSCESVSSYKKNMPPPLLGISSPSHSKRPSLEPIQSSDLWAPATLPPLPSPTATENLRMLEDLLTPHLGTRVASSEHSSSASLRDHVDYSRPISGLVRNRVHSTMTFQTEDTATIVDGKLTSTIQ